MKRNGFTVIELLIVICIIFIIAAIVLSQTVGRGSGEHAEQQAKEHADKLGWIVDGMSCAAVDSDGDGYISCTLVLEDRSERNLECAGGGWMSWRIEGCKAAKMIDTRAGQ